MRHKLFARIGNRGRRGEQVALALCLVATVLALGGCEMDSFFDQSNVGRWEQTPITMPILNRLAVIEPTNAVNLPTTSIRPSDLVPDVHDYIIGPGDLMTVTIFELMQPGQPTIENRRVTDTGYIRLPIIGQVRAQGRTTAQLEQAIADVLKKKGVLTHPNVSVVMQQERQSTFSIIGSPETGGTEVGTYVIPKPSFTLLDAIAMAHGVPGSAKTLLIFREAPLTAAAAGTVAQQAQLEQSGEAGTPAPSNPSQLINQLMKGIGPGAATQPGNKAQGGNKAPAGLSSALGQPNAGSQWVYVGGQWVRSGETNPETGQTAEQNASTMKELSKMVTERIIQIPYDKLVAGDMRYNIIVRPGDVIKVPDQNAGFVYVMGAINRPGAYVIPSDNTLTIKQLVASAGGLSQLGVPERVDLVRRIGHDHEATVRLNVRKIFDGTEPDIFLKPNDLLNFGTNFPATPMAVFRNGLRATYGFGFILDHNFGPITFGTP